jgi:predicted nucleotidyltransferase
LPGFHEIEKVEINRDSWHNANRITAMGDIVITGQEFESIIKQLNSELKNKYNDFVGITFLGSRYRGDFSEESDFDIVIMFSKKPGWQRQRDVLGIVLEKELQYDIVIDAKIYHEGEIKKQNTPFRIAVCQEGAHYGV